MKDFKVILYHKQSTSARTRFVRFEENTIFVDGPLEALSQVDDSVAEITLLHPTTVLRETGERLGLPEECLAIEPEYQYAVEVSGGKIPVLLLAINLIDPPFKEIEAHGGAFIDLTQARGLPTVELELLRHAYELVLGG
ncbi:MAG: hypothetical protein AB2813_14895 [Candidatus Sedimenticola endophacoides]